MGYSTVAKKVYGEKCELCGWGKATADVHHIDYQEHQEMENDMREALKNEDNELFNHLQAAALMEGYGLFDRNQLPKNDNPGNLAVLCPNCHRELHFFDYGKEVLRALPPRRVLSIAVIKMLEGE